MQAMDAARVLEGALEGLAERWRAARPYPN
jgi:hypothetical protein